MKKFYIAKARRLRSTPFSSRIESQGLTAYTTYNHMLLPAAFEGTEKELIDFCKETLAGFKVPKKIEFCELPKTSTGKIQKFELRKKAKE